MTGVLRVLHICTGNICRSPMAEHLMRRGLADRLGEAAGLVAVESVGTCGLSGEPMQPEARASLSGYDVDGSAFRARELRAEHVANAELILVATREHRAAAVVLHPRAAVRTFTLLEFARLCQDVQEAQLPHGDVVERGRALVAAARAQRGQTALQSPGDDDLVDPYRQPQDAYTACAERVQAALQRPLDLLAADCGTVGCR